MRQPRSISARCSTAGTADARRDRPAQEAPCLPILLLLAIQVPARCSRYLFAGLFFAAAFLPAFAGCFFPRLFVAADAPPSSLIKALPMGEP
jgi:hypothetical protein